MSRFSEPLVLGKGYDRMVLAKLWRLGGFQAIGRGVFTPKGERQIFLFVTRERLGWMTRTTTSWMGTCYSGMAKRDMARTNGSFEPRPAERKSTFFTEITAGNFSLTTGRS